MERNINIAKILKDKPKGTKLYADAFGELSLEVVTITQHCIISTKSKIGTFHNFYKDGKYIEYGEPILVPSKEMRDWSKFAWKRGDVLVDRSGLCQVVFKEFEDDTYTTFEGMYWLKCDEDDSLEYKKKISSLNTADFHLDTSENIRCYIQTISELTGRKLNLETLEKISMRK